jgi:hypothetical protein
LVLLAIVSELHHEGVRGRIFLEGELPLLRAIDIPIRHLALLAQPSYQHRNFLSMEEVQEPVLDASASGSELVDPVA